MISKLHLIKKLVQENLNQEEDPGQSTEISLKGIMVSQRTLSLFVSNLWNVDKR